MKVSLANYCAVTSLATSLAACAVDAPKESELKFEVAWSVQSSASSVASPQTFLSMASDGSFSAAVQYPPSGNQVFSQSVTRYSSDHEVVYTKLYPVTAAGPMLGAIAAAGDGSTYVAYLESVDEPGMLQKLDARGAVAWTIAVPGKLLPNVLRETDSGAIEGASDATFFAVTPDGDVSMKASITGSVGSSGPISSDGVFATSMPCIDVQNATCVYTFDSNGTQTEVARTSIFSVGPLAWMPDDSLVIGGFTESTATVVDVLGVSYDASQSQDFIARLAPSGTTMWVAPTNGASTLIDAGVGQIVALTMLPPDGSGVNVETLVGYSPEGVVGPALASNLTSQALTGGAQGRVVLGGALAGIFTDGAQTIEGDGNSLIVELALH